MNSAAERKRQAKREWHAARYAKNPEAVRAQWREDSRRWRAKNPERHRANVVRNLRKLNKLPEPTRPPPDSCECCGAKFEATPFKGPHLDHCHATGKFRGWICGKCNRGLGGLGDTLEALTRAVNYLERAK